MLEMWMWMRSMVMMWMVKRTSHDVDDEMMILILFFIVMVNLRRSM